MVCQLALKVVLRFLEMLCGIYDSFIEMLSCSLHCLNIFSNTQLKIERGVATHNLSIRLVVCIDQRDVFLLAPV